MLAAERMLTTQALLWVTCCMSKHSHQINQMQVGQVPLSARSRGDAFSSGQIVPGVFSSGSDPVPIRKSDLTNIAAAAQDVPICLLAPLSC